MSRLLWFIPAVLLLLAVLLLELGDDPVRVETVATTSTTSTVPSTTTSVATTTTHYHPPTTVKAAAVARSAPIVRQAPIEVNRTYGEVQDIIRAGFARFGAHVAEQAVRVAGCETGGTWNPNMTGSQGEVGVLQVHPRYHSARAARFGWSMADLYDPAKNVVVAADIYSESGWGPWTCRTAA